MDFVYICKEGKNEELKYSIRSVLANVPNANIWVVGGKPIWYKGNYIHIRQDMSKYRNVMNNLHHIIKSVNIDDNFVFMNDDFYIMQPIKKIPVLHGGSLSKKIELYDSIVPMSGYTTKLKTTYRKIIDYGIKEPLDYDLHVPFNISKKLLYPIIANKNIRTLWRSIYGNYYNIGGNAIEDVKVYSAGPLQQKSYRYDPSQIFLSTQENAFNDYIKEILQNKFPNPSSLEKMI